MNLKTIATGFGAVMLLVGILGFVPGLAPDGMLLGIFMVDGLHNVVHVLTGIAAIAAGMMGGTYPKLYFKAFGVVYGLVTVLGFLTGHGLVALIPVNMADNILHIAITAFALYLGFGMSEPSKAK